MNRHRKKKERKKNKKTERQTDGRTTNNGDQNSSLEPMKLMVGKGLGLYILFLRLLIHD